MYLKLFEINHHTLLDKPLCSCSCFSPSKFQCLSVYVCFLCLLLPSEVQASSVTANKAAISAALRGALLQLVKDLVLKCSCKHPHVRETSFEPDQNKEYKKR